MLSFPRHKPSVVDGNFLSLILALQIVSGCLRCLIPV